MKKLIEAAVLVALCYAGFMAYVVIVCAVRNFLIQ